MPKEHLQFIFIHGKGGAGKDTQADLFLREHESNAIKISTVVMYRDAKNGTGEYGKYHDRIAPYIASTDAGILLPNEVIVSMVRDGVKDLIAGGKEIFIFTGFPRTEAQLTMMDNMLNELGHESEISAHHICYSLSDEACRRRAQHRRDSARMRGEPTRVDDEPSVIENRLRVFRELTEPMIQRLEKEGRLITIDAEGSIDSIETETSTRLSKER